jgi:hypothetical protein
VIKNQQRQVIQNGRSILYLYCWTAKANSKSLIRLEPELYPLLPIQNSTVAPQHHHRTSTARDPGESHPLWRAGAGRRAAGGAKRSSAAFPFVFAAGGLARPHRSTRAARARFSSLNLPFTSFGWPCQPAAGRL